MRQAYRHRANHLAPAISASLLFLSGCSLDSNSGMQSRARFSGRPDLKCVDAVLRSTPGVGQVSRWDGTRMGDGMTYNWSYGGDLDAMLEISVIAEQGEVRTEYFNGNIRLSDDMSRGKAFEPLMRRVDAAVEARCHLPVSKVASIDSVDRDGWHSSPYSSE